ncbi:MAG: metallophosphoesterase family protein [Anaerolineae bacterium]
MRVAILSDIHGNIRALDAVLGDLEERGPFDHLVIAGDLCVFGPRPKEVVDRLREIPCEIVQGNTDLWLVDPESMPAGDRSTSETVAWTRDRLEKEDLSLLQGLGFSYEVTPVRGHDLLVVHANPHDLVAPIYPDTDIGELTRLTENVVAEVLAFGHVHIAFVRKVGGLTLVDVGSVGMPRDGDSRASYAALEWDGNSWHIAHHRVEYDLDGTAEQMRKGRMPHAKQRIKILREASYS